MSDLSDFYKESYGLHICACCELPNAHRDISIWLPDGRVVCDTCVESGVPLDDLYDEQPENQPHYGGQFVNLFEDYGTKPCENCGHPTEHEDRVKSRDSGMNLCGPCLLEMLSDSGHGPLDTDDVDDLDDY